MHLHLPRPYASLFLVFVCCAFPINAQQDKAPFEFPDANTPLALLPGQENKAQVLNNTTRALSLNIAIVDASLKVGQQLSSVIEIEPKVLQLAPAGSGSITLRIKSSSALESGAALTAYLVASEDSSNTVKRRPLTFAVPTSSGAGNSKPIVPVSLVSTLKAKVFYCPWIGSEKPRILEFPLPLNVVVVKPEDKANLLKEKDKDGKEKNKTAARLATAYGETALVEYTSLSEILSSGTSGLVMQFKSSGHPGEFTGNLLGIKPEDPSKAVTVTVVSAHWWPFAALAILAGILLYYAMQWYLNVIRKVWGLQEQEAETQGVFKISKERFEETAGEFAPLTISDDFDVQNKALIKSIKSLKYQNFLRLNESSEAYKAIVARLIELRGAARDWAVFAETQLNPLKEALEGARPGFQVHPPGLEPAESEKPLIAVEAEKRLVITSPEMSLDAFKLRSSGIVALLPGMSAWDSLNSKSAALWQKCDKLAANSENPVSSEIESLKDGAKKIWRKLWLRSDFAPLSVDEELYALRDSLATATNDASTYSAGFGAGITASESAKKIADEMGILRPTQRQKEIQLKRLGLDGLSLALAVTVALQLGLTQFYFDKPWGTPRDYLAAFLFGFAAKALVDAVTLAIDKLWPTAIAGRVGG